MPKTLLQAILAAFCAILAHTSCMGGGGMNIGARVGCWSGGLSAKSYVQDGIGNMFDGIENVGFGQHDIDSSYWFDLITGERASLVANATFDQNRISIPTNNDGVNFGADNQYCILWRTLELVCSLPLTTKKGFLQWRAQYDGYGIGPCTDINGVICDNYDYHVCPYVPYDDMTPFHCAFIKNNSSDSKITSSVFKNGVICTSGTCRERWCDGSYSLATITRGNRVTNGEVFAIRAYNRVLTAAEIAANYAVDKARFNLT